MRSGISLCESRRREVTDTHCTSVCIKNKHTNKNKNGVANKPVKDKRSQSFSPCCQIFVFRLPELSPSFTDLSNMKSMWIKAPSDKKQDR